MKHKCEECLQYQDALPFLFMYCDPDTMAFTHERKTCEACWRRIRSLHRIISYGPGTKRNKVRYERVTVVGAPIQYQQTLF
jgi:hypothetical protein